MYVWLEQGRSKWCVQIWYVSFTIIGSRRCVFDVATYYAHEAAGQDPSLDSFALCPSGAFSCQKLPVEELVGRDPVLEVPPRSYVGYRGSYVIGYMHYTGSVGNDGKWFEPKYAYICSLWCMCKYLYVCVCVAER